MNPFQVFTGEFRHFIKKPMVIVTFVAVALIPILYSGFLIKGTWDPYGQLQDLPVAIVNQDQGAMFEGKTMTVGKEFVDELRNNDEFAWSFVSPEEASLGMKNNHYYATITIPPEFSADAASLASDNPKQAEIIYESNSFYNFVAGQISESATKELRNQLSANLTEAYSRSILSQFETISTGFSEAGKGATQLHTGSVELSDGIGKVKTNLALLVSGTERLSGSVGLLQAGVLKLGEGSTEVSNGAASLSSGTNQLADAGKKLEQGAEKTVRGSSALLTGLQSSMKGANDLTKGLESSLAGSGQLETGITNSASATGDLSDSSAQIAAGLEKLTTDFPDLASDANMQKLLAASKAVAKGAKELNTAQKQLLTGSKSLSQGTQRLLTGSQQLSKGQQQLLQGASDLQTGEKQLYEGLKQYNSKFTELASGTKKLEQGAGQLSQGAGELSTGMGQIAVGIDKVADGAKQLDTGAVQLQTGSLKLVDGSSQLAVKLNDAAGETSAFKADDQRIHMLAEPVAIKANDDRKVTLYANGIAPYFISLALFAGSLVFTTIYSARSTNATGATGVRLLISKLLTFSIMSVLQSLVVCTVLVFFLGLKVQSIPLFYLFTIVVGLTFMLLIQALVTWLDQPGRFVVLLIMIFQLASSAGTFPVELLPGWAKVLHRWLPMTYSIRGFRDVISSGAYEHMWHQVGYLSIFIVASVILTSVYFLVYKKRHTDDEQLFPVTV